MFLSGVALALTAEEIELLRRAGVSEERIAEMIEEQGVEVEGDPGTELKEAEPEPAPAVLPAVKPAATGVEPETKRAAVEARTWSHTDWNEDGVYDIIGGSQLGELNVYINVGSNIRPEFEDREEVEDGDVDSGSISVPCITDWNNDGMKDVLLGNRGGTVYLYINHGTNESPEFEDGEEMQDGDIDAGSYSAPAVVDWNGDGKKDLVLGNFDGEILVYINRGADESPSFDEEPYELDVKVFSHAVPFIVKNYNNGLFDMLSGCADGRVYRFYNAGSDTSPGFSNPEPIKTDRFPVQFNGNTNVIAVDWDGDGLEDLVVSERMTSQEAGREGQAALTGKEKDRHYSRVYFIKNVGTNEEPRYNDVEEILHDSRDINI